MVKISNEIWSQIKDQVIKLIEQHHRPAEEVILDDVDVRQLLKVSRRTLLNYRLSGNLKFSKIENKIFYFLSDVIEFVKGGRADA